MNISEFTNEDIIKANILFSLSNIIYSDDVIFKNKDNIRINIFILKINKDEYKNTLELKLKKYHLSDYFLLKFRKVNSWNGQYLVMSFSFSEKGLKNIDAIYALCKMKGLLTE